MKYISSVLAAFKTQANDKNINNAQYFDIVEIVTQYRGHPVLPEQEGLT
jgi:hypothetical protein